MILKRSTAIKKNAEIKHVSCPGYRETIKYLENHLKHLVNRNSIVLDAGCGFRNQLISTKEVKLLIGCDINLSASK